MNVYIETINKYNTNYVSFNQYKFTEIPSLGFQNYFGNSRENIYFLVLSVFQLLTWEYINILPSNWSPSGPFSTLIPLVICFFIEILGLIVRYVNQYRKTYTYNYTNKVKKCIYNGGNYEMQTIPVKDIRIGELVFIKTGQVIPIDCLVFYTLEENVAKINYSNLNGEPDIIVKQSITNKTEFEKFKQIKVLDIIDYPNSIKLFDAKVKFNDQQYIKLDHEYFVPGGSVNKGCNMVVLVIEVGKDIRSYTSVKNDNIFTTNFLDNKIGTSLKGFYIPLLFIYILTTVGCSAYYQINVGVFSIMQKVIQSWIILNGIVPFSAKLILLFNRNIQSYLYSTPSCEYMKSNVIDNIPYTTHLICDKTGTITKNKLTLKYFTSTKDDERILSDIIDIKLLPDIARFIIMSINVRANIYSTHEDKILAEKIYSLGYVFKQEDSEIIIYEKSNKQSTKYNILDNKNLLFSSSRKLSSVIFENNGQAYIVSKGPIQKIQELLIESDTNNIRKDLALFNTQAPHLRTIAIAYKPINYNPDTKSDQYESSGQYNYITIMGIEDELQDCIMETVSHIQKTHQVSICTGDRKETAVEIARLSGIYKYRLIESGNETSGTFNEVGGNLGVDNMVTAYNFLFSGEDIASVLVSLDKLELFKNRLFNSRGFIGYSLIPQHKKFIANLFESSNINVTSVGDGNNDIPMLKTSTVAISVDTGVNNNVVSSSDIRVTSFKELTKIFDDSAVFLNINKLGIYFVFYKTMLINTVLLCWIFHNNLDLTKVLFTFIEIQGFHLVWGMLPMIAASFYIPTNKISYGSVKYMAPLIGVLNATSILYLTKDKWQIFTATVLSININFIIMYKYHKINIVTVLAGLFVFFIYIFSFGNIMP